MKKKLEADLISIAHRILKLKNKSDINQLYLETQKLYEKLAVLKFVDENFGSQKPTIGQNELESEIAVIFEKEEEPTVEIQNETAVTETEPVEAEPLSEEVTEEEIIAEEVSVEEVSAEENFEPEIIEEIIAEEKEEETIEEPILKTTEEPIEEKSEEPVFEEPAKTEIDEVLSFSTRSETNPIPDFKPAFELENEAEEEISTPSKPVQISFEDFGINYADAHFVKVDSFEAVPPAPSINEFKEKKTTKETAILEPVETKSVPLNEKLAKGFHIDLNDRIAFTKNLFGNSSEDYSRVLNQLLTFDSYGEAQEFIENMVKPDYNNWEGKDDYAERFLGIIEKKFS